MRRRVVALAGIAVAALAAPLVVLGQTGALKPLTTILNRPWPAPVVAEDEGKPAPVLAPADAIKTFHLAPGYRLELVAAEPLTKDPILAEFDGDGRLWVVEMHGFSINEQMENSLEPIGEVAVLEDTNADGVFDKRTVFLDKLVLPRALKVLDKSCALVGEPPNLIRACDTNGDLKADSRDIIDKGFGVPNNIEHTANGLYWGMDNTLVVSEHGYNVDFVGGEFKIAPNLRRGQWGVTQDSGGRIYRNVNTDPLFVDYVAPKYYVRNPNLIRTNGLYENLVKQEDTLIWPVHPTRGVNRGYRPDIFREDGSSTYYGGVSSPLIYRGDRLPADVQNQPLVVDGPTNIVHLLKMTDDNGKLSAADFYKKGELIASTDVRFRPVQVIGGPDGAVYVVDMYRGISQDGPIQTDYLRDYNAKRELAKGINYGRIYRLVHETTVLDPKKPQMSKDTPAQLVSYLSHPNGWWRDTAQQLLVQRGDKSTAAALKRLAGSAPQAYTRLHALWTLQGLGVLDQATAVKALGDASPDVRAAAIRLSETWLTQPAVKAAVLKKADDGNWFVRRQLAATLGELPADQRMAPIVDLLRRYGDDPILVDIAVSGLNEQEEETLAALLSQPQVSPDAVLALAGATAKGRDPATVQKLLAMAGDANRPAPIRTALLNGAALGLQGAAGGGGGNAVVGGRAGGGVPGLQQRQAAGPGIDLPAEPTAVTRVASGTGEVADAAKAVVALVKWPGKPAPPSGPARTPDEEKLFAAGKEVFANNCAACHGADGGGVAQVGAKLAGGKFVTLPGDASIRILVNGLEGALGVMPPLGAAMSDEEVAAVLTFVRQSWGNTSPAIQTAQVKETRAAYAHRTTPWTEAELATRRR